MTSFYARQVLAPHQVACFGHGPIKSGTPPPMYVYPLNVCAQKTCILMVTKGACFKICVLLQLEFFVTEFKLKEMGAELSRSRLVGARSEASLQCVYRAHPDPFCVETAAGLLQLSVGQFNTVTDQNPHREDHVGIVISKPYHRDSEHLTLTELALQGVDVYFFMHPSQLPNSISQLLQPHPRELVLDLRHVAFVPVTTITGRMHVAPFVLHRPVCDPFCSVVPCLSNPLPRFTPCLILARGPSRARPGAHQHGAALA